MSGIRKGKLWGRATTAPADAEIAGDDAALAAVAAQRPGIRVVFRPGPTSDLGRALGLGGHDPDERTRPTEVAVDGLRLDREPGMALNAVVIGTPPDRMRPWTRSRHVEVSVDGRDRFTGRATTVVVASGQFLRGADIVPRGHPGDGRAEVQIYALGWSERPAMRRRLPQGTHLPHPRIHQVTGRRVEVRMAGGTAPLEADGVRSGRVGGLTVEVLPGIISLLV
jgi:hypothetical protein